jgi:hypothetical protein
MTFEKSVQGLFLVDMEDSHEFVTADTDDLLDRTDAAVG